MAKKKPSTKRARAKPSKPSKGTGGGGAALEGADATILDSDSQKKLHSPFRLAELESEITELEKARIHLSDLLCDERIKTRRLTEEKEKLEERLKAAQRFPNDMYQMDQFLRGAPRAWHLQTFAEMIVRRLIANTKRQPAERKAAAYEALAEIALFFRTTPKGKMPEWLSLAMGNPTFRAVWDRAIPRRTRGGMGDNGSIQVIFTFVELSMGAFEKSGASTHLGRTMAEVYSQPDCYWAAYKDFAKELWEDGGREAANAFWMDEGYKLRPNHGNSKSPKRSFSLFAPDIKKQVMRNIETWRRALPPKS